MRAIMIALIAFLHLVIAANGLPLDTGLIVGGSDAQIENFPYMASIRKWGMHQCGAAIVNQKWVLTAAHCFTGEPLDEFSLRTGSSDIWFGGVDHELALKIIHENYNKYNKNNDIALVKVTDAIKFDTYTKIIPLPENTFKLEPEDIATVSGWGLTTESGWLSIELQYVELEIIDSATCNKLYSKLRNITETMLCAGYIKGEKDACQGDSGGPLVVRNRIVGIVSWGRGCARPDYPGVYSNIIYLQKWIIQKMSADLSSNLDGAYTEKLKPK